MKVLERVIERRVRNIVKIDSMQFGFMAGKSTTDAIFIVRQLQEKYLARNKELWMAFVDLEKAFDRVPREVVWWALRCLGVDEWIVSVIKAMYEDATTTVRVNGRESKAFSVRVGVHQGSVLSPLLFIIVLEALSREFREGLPMELLYADDLVLVAETEELLMEKLRKWKRGMELKGLRVNIGKTKVMRCQVRIGQAEESGLGYVADFKCKRCLDGDSDPVGLLSGVGLEPGVGVECVSGFCCLGDTLGSGGGVVGAAGAGVGCAWAGFGGLSPILTVRGASYRIKGGICGACVRSVLVYGAGAWAVGAGGLGGLGGTERVIVGWMCGVSLGDGGRGGGLCGLLGVGCVAGVVGRGGLGWFGHLGRGSVDGWVSACGGLVVGGARGRGGGGKTWEQCVGDGVRLLGLHPGWAVFEDVWRDLIWGKRLTLA